jgi:hypothetical protein
MGKTKDFLQEGKPLEKPEVRVWIHDPEGDYYLTFESVEQARAWIRAKNNPNIEPEPVIAWKGYEWSVDEYEREVKKREAKPKKDAFGRLLDRIIGVEI